VLKVVMFVRVLLSKVMLPEVDTVVVLLIVVFTSDDMSGTLLLKVAYNFLLPRRRIRCLSTSSISSTSRSIPVLEIRVSVDAYRIVGGPPFLSLL
jgi:hypothetical protein